MKSNLVNVFKSDFGWILYMESVSTTLAPTSNLLGVFPYLGIEQSAIFVFIDRVPKITRKNTLNLKLNDLVNCPITTIFPPLFTHVRKSKDGCTQYHGMLSW